MNRVPFHLIIISFIAILMTGCKFYHDTAAHYNAHFLAEQRMTAIEDSMMMNINDDYIEVLQVLPSIDSTINKSYASGFDYIIEKASRPIKFHETSQWVDECYLLIGKARLYEEDYGNALNTFKFINAKTEDPNSRHGALIMLLWMYDEKDEKRNFDLIKQHINQVPEPFNSENTKMYHLVMANHYIKKRKYNFAVEHMAIATPLEKNKLKRTRYNYILAQLYEESGNNELAYKTYFKVIKGKANYLQEFSARISRMKLTTSADPALVEKADKYFDRQLKEEKNFELRDRIYFEMAAFELNQGELEKALNLYNESVQTNTSNPNLKGYAYLEMGKSYYYTLSDYPKAALYYDSAINVLPKTYYQYQEDSVLSSNLTELAKYTSEIEQQERLLNLYAMSDAQREVYLKKEIKLEKDDILKKIEYDIIRETKNKKPETTNELIVSKDESTAWYFYNSKSVVSGKTQFLRTWGNRALGDNWRRSSVIQRSSSQNTIVKTEEKKSKKEQKAEADLFANVKSLEDRLAEIPQTEESLTEIEVKLQEAFFNLEKVYLYRFKSITEAQSTAQNIFDRYPESEFGAEAAYILYLSCQKELSCDPSYYESILADLYPSSFYAKIVEDPDYVKNKNIAEREIIQRYEDAFKTYKAKDYKLANEKIEELVTIGQESSIIDKIRLLQVVIVGKTSIYFEPYMEALNGFITEFPESDLKPYAQALLDDISEDDLKKPRIPGRY
ncbi:type IX secretion system periplasmic lipoprotein PorW/SprE [Sediminitomix flava]|uniref:Uncharacterized protein n=1 Tax=Sediminitomix flava TaxID=379075 RepID=A0A315ZCV7_SEDFL|nr:hypothetical protein [Sediminitomix flava]PWJ42939.1 hypothetical protein BC781_102486 [Sediminitomix flava]